MFRFAVKAGIAGSAVYYVKEQGIWKGSEESVKVYDKISTALEPHLQQVKSNLPFELPHLPQTEQTSYLAKQYWNRGVHATFDFLIRLPGYITNWTKKGVETTLEHENVQKFIEVFFTGSPEPSKDVK